MAPCKRSAPSVDGNDVGNSVLGKEREPKLVRLHVPSIAGVQYDKIQHDVGVEESHSIAIAVTPGTHTKTRYLDEEEENEKLHPESRSVRRSLFPSITNAIANSAVTISPTKEIVSTKRKLIFGRNVKETVVKRSVRQVYAIVKKLTGSLGGNSSGGPIYGELTMGSMQKIVNLMKDYTDFGPSSRFIDVGSGIGKPNLHVIQDPGVEFSFGIEIDESRWLLGMNCLKVVLDTAYEQQCRNISSDMPDDEQIRHNCIFAMGDIRKARTFDPFTHVYMFSVGFPPELWCVLKEVWNRSASPYLICYHGPKDIIHSYEFDVELVIQTSTSMHGSKEGHTGYVYRRTNTYVATKKDTSEIVPCDPLFVDAWQLITENGLHSLKTHVEAKVESYMVSGACTRSRRRQG